MKVHTDPLHRMAYATDASAYREMPVGVAFPESADDVRQLLRQARDGKTHLIPRAAGTSIAGQVVGKGIVVDIKGWNKILEINAEERWARIQPGVVRDELNLALKPFGLFFSPETSTSNRCCLGGMFGNNSCGTHSLVYGSTRDHVIACKGVLSDGSEFDTTRLQEPGYRQERPLLDAILKQLEEWKDCPAIRQLLVENFPDRSLRRRSCGYAIDEAVEAQDLCKLLAGSEGTLAFVTEMTVSLDPLPPKEKMVVCAHCNTLEGSFHANLIALKHRPAAVELMDGKILELSFQNIELKRNTTFIDGLPAAVLIAEFWADTREGIDAQAEAFEKDVMASGLVSTCTRVYGAEVAKVWDLRKAGLGVLSGMKGDAKPIGVIEDTAVAPERLPAYMQDFREMLDRLHASCVYYGHISTGELHLRPILNIKTAEGRKLFRDIATETALLVRKHKGSLSGEHGDGRLRGEFIPLMYGPEVYRLMQEVKRTWDPDGLFNMNKIVDTPPMDEFLRFEVGQTYPIESMQTFYNWRAAFDECKVDGASGVRSQAHALMCSIEQCNGAGACLKSNLIGGTMCPAYKVSHDETFSTRARANILREVLTHGTGNFDSPEMAAVLDSCLACKGCLSECPSNVDMTRIRSQVLQMLYDRHGTPFRSWMVARMALIEQLGHLVYPFYNFFATTRWTSTIIKKIVSFAPERAIPPLSPRTMRQLVAKDNRRAPRSAKKVLLFADEFTDLQEAELGQTFARLLTALGYQVIVPKHVESGRAAMSKGCRHLAASYARKNVSLLRNLVSDDTPLVGIEPSCILSFRDEYPDLVPEAMRADAERLAKNCLLYDEFIMREVARGNITAEQFRTDAVEIWLHGHCHQKSIVGIEKTVAMFHLLKGCQLHVIPSSCCGMAGSFGYEKEHYKTSIAIGEMILFPAVRKAINNANPSQTPTLVAAPGTSCRQQILDGTGIHASHPIEIMYRWLKNAPVEQ